MKPRAVQVFAKSRSCCCGSVHVEVGRMLMLGLRCSAQFPRGIAQNAAGLVTFCSCRFYIRCYFWKRPPPSPTLGFRILTLQSTGTPEQFETDGSKDQKRPSLNVGDRDDHGHIDQARKKCSKQIFHYFPYQGMLFNEIPQSQSNWTLMVPISCIYTSGHTKKRVPSPRKTSEEVTL